ncbi:hypothetical protein NE236_18635 [Actinoallomurus purpureus]|uniref:hypothetical protein n=1 Tax=Actinoallomurus purpureus TaxID=478114 RepID=UPI002093E4C9|nr:hypothetical protein [Actinoallomurus purpureus]MCO6007008.1 hypothetical protein [Actinoallomurus purpureus]
MSTEPARARRLLAPSTAFAASGAVFAALYVAAGAPTPLLVVFEQQWRFPAWMLTVAFASYALGLLAALLVAGSLSDHVGRRPVLIGSLLVELGAMLMFVFASNIGWVLGFGIFSHELRSEDPVLQEQRRHAAAELEDLGFGAIWLGGNSSVHHAAALAESTERIALATGILNIWHEGADTVARQRAALEHQA